MSETVLWEKTGDQGNHWRVAYLTGTSPDPAAPVQVLIRATRGSSVLSDIAIDNIVAVPGTCDQHNYFPSIIG